MRRQRRRDERGAITVWLVLSSLLMVTVIGITVDLGGLLHAQQRARSIASQAARAAAERVTANAMTGATPTVDPTQARAAARAHLGAAGIQGTVTLSAGGTRVTVDVITHYTPLFLGAAGELTVTGTSTAQLTRAVDGTER